MKKRNTSPFKSIPYCIVLMLFLASSLLHLEAQTYPYWDAGEPGGINHLGGNGKYGPFIASTNGVFAIDGTPDRGSIARWTKCGGWEDLPGLQVNDISSDGLFAQRAMTVHDHYLYVVGSLTVGSINTSIARFDLNTGTWTALGDSFTATNIVIPTTVAVDDDNRIYVGFKFWYFMSGVGGPHLVDMLDVSTNDGASWQCVGTGLKETFFEVEPNEDDPNGATTLFEGGISALHADGTNLYIGGDFSGPDGIVSSNIVMWTGSAWRAFGSGGSGVGPQQLDMFFEWNGDTVNDITSIGTNVYAAGVFNFPYQGFARFSNVTGESLPTGDPVNSLFNWQIDDLDGYMAGTSVTVNGTNLYFGGNLGVDLDDGYFLGCLSDPTAASPTGWTANVSSDGSSLKCTGTLCMTSTTNGNAIYVAGDFSGTGAGEIPSDGFSRLVTAADEPSPTAEITSIGWTNNVATLHISGTPGSHWHVYSSYDAASWNEVGSDGVTLWNGSGVFIDSNSLGQPFYQLADYCTSLVANACPTCTNECTNCIVSSAKIVNIQFDGDNSATRQIGLAGTGINTSDYWNIVEGDGKHDGDTGNPYDAFTTAFSLKDTTGTPTQVGLSILYSDNTGEAPAGAYFGSDPVPLINTQLYTPAGDSFTLAVILPTGHTYDLYCYSSQPYSGGHNNSTFTLDGSSSQSTSTSNYTTDDFYPGFQYIVFSGVSAGSHYIGVSSGVEPFVNGMQIVIH